MRRRAAARSSRQRLSAPAVGVACCRGEAPMRFPHRPRKGVRVGGGQDEMNGVGHAAIGPPGNAVGATALGEQVAIEGISPGLMNEIIAA